MKCSKCQKNLPKDVYVCPYCGHENQPKNKRLSIEDIPSELAHLSIAQLQKRIKKLNMLDHYKMVILGAIVVLVVIFVILGISRPRWKNQTVNNFHDDITEISNVNAAGNAAFNITNGGNIVLAGESIYMTDKDGLVYKGDLGLTEKELLLSSHVTSLNIHEDELWFVDQDHDNALSKYNLSSGMTQTSTYKGRQLYVIGNYAYYINEDDFDAVYYVGLSLRQPATKLTASNVRDFTISGDWVYYTLSDGIYRIPILGGEQQKLSSQQAEKLYVYNGTVYYIDAVNHQLVSLRMINGQEEYTTLVETQVESFVVANDYVYYIDMAQNNALYKLSLSTKESTALNAGSSSHLQLVSSWLYYYDSGADQFCFTTIDENALNTTNLNDIEEISSNQPSTVMN